MSRKIIQTSFAVCITRFLTGYLPGERNFSPQTIKSYSQALKMYIMYLNSAEKIKPERIDFKDLTANSVKEFLKSMELSENISPSTFNQRLSALKAFIRYAMLEHPEFLENGQRILAIPSKRSPKPEIIYLEKDAMRALLKIPDQTSIQGRRELAIMAMLYDTGARVQELIDLKIKDVRLENPETVTLNGKRRKIRTVPIMAETAKVLVSYLRDRGLVEQSAFGDLYLFSSTNRSQFTRPGIAKILKRNFATAKKANPTLIFPKDIYPHAIRASKAIHLLESGVNIIAIRDFLGHVSVSTTQIYLQVNDKIKRDAIARAYPQLMETVPEWKNDSDLLALLKELCS